MMISSENAGNVTMEGKFPCAVCRKGLGIYKPIKMKKKKLSKNVSQLD